MHRHETNTRKEISITCDRCGSIYERSLRKEQSRFERFGKNICDKCFVAIHNGVSESLMGRETPGFLSGTTRDIKLQTCDICKSSWTQDIGNARKFFYSNGCLSLCRGCKSDTNHLCNETIEVTCSITGKKYRVTRETFAKSPNGPWISNSASQKGKCIDSVTRLKISAANRGRKLTEEAKRKISERSKQPDIIARLRSYTDRRKKGQIPHPFLGKHHSEESKELLRIANTGQIRSKEFCQHISQKRKEYFANGGHSEETRRKISQTITRLRAEGFKPESAHKQDVYTPKKPCVPDYEKQTPYTLSSSWESLFARWLDLEPTVTCWTYEAVSIDLDGGKRPYLTDFIYCTDDGRTFLVEVKPLRKIERNVDRARDKWEALQIYCQAKGWEPLLVVEDDLVDVAELFGEDLCI